jgi:hypothetical protein
MPYLRRGYVLPDRDERLNQPAALQPAAPGIAPATTEYCQDYEDDQDRREVHAVLR